MGRKATGEEAGMHYESAAAQLCWLLKLHGQRCGQPYILLVGNWLRSHRRRSFARSVRAVDSISFQMFFARERRSVRIARPHFSIAFIFVFSSFSNPHPSRIPSVFTPK